MKQSMFGIFFEVAAGVAAAAFCGVVGTVLCVLILSAAYIALMWTLFGVIAILSGVTGLFLGEYLHALLIPVGILSLSIQAYVSDQLRKADWF